MMFSIIIPTHNRSDALDKTLSVLRQQVFDHEWEVIVINNNCSDNTDEVVMTQAKDFPVPLSLVHEKKPGASAARNTGVKAAKGKYLAFIDNDILTPRNFLQLHYDNIQKYGGNCWFVGRIENMPEQLTSHFGKFRKTLETPASYDIIPFRAMTGANTSMLRDQFNQLGGFDENFHVASGEDMELAMRGLKAGIKIYFDPSIVVLHNDWAGTSIRDFSRRQRLYTQTEPFFWKKYGNETPRLKMVRENLPPSLKHDGLRLFCWKNTKRMLGSKPGQEILIGLSGMFEKIFPKKFILWRLYRLTIAGAIYKGFNEGLKIFSIKERFVAG